MHINRLVFLDTETILYIDINIDKRFYDIDLGKEDCTQRFGGKASRKTQVEFHNRLMVSVKSDIKGVYPRPYTKYWTFKRTHKSIFSG